LLCSRSVVLHFDSLYAKPTVAEKLRAALSFSTPDLTLILGDINSEARLWNRYPSVHFPVGSERFLILTSSMWNSIGR
jgi:hypothetical protein